MAFEIAPLKSPETPVVRPDKEKSFLLASRLFAKGVIDIDDAAEIAGVKKSVLEELFLKQGILKSRRLMVCGGAGFIGSNFVRFVLQHHPYDRVVVYDALTYAGRMSNLEGLDPSRYVFYKGNIADTARVQEVVQKEKIDYIINFAAETHVTRSLVSSEDFLKTNVTGVHSLLEVARTDRSIKRLLHVSTDEVYGTLELDEDRQFFEDDPFEPNVPYSAAKAGGDLFARAWHHTYDVPVIVTHCTNNYGPFQHIEKLIPYSLSRLMQDKPLVIHGRGQHVRDWIFVEDHCKALDLILQNGTDGEMYNVAANEERSTLEIARMLLKVMGRKEDFLIFVEDRPGNDLRYSLNTDKVYNEFGWKPEKSFDEGMHMTIQWYHNHMAWVQEVWRDEQDNQVLHPTRTKWKEQLSK